jgi:predicted HNH restriction endonuclease
MARKTLTEPERPSRTSTGAPSNVSDAEILAVLSTLEYEVDERARPDEMDDDRFKGRFRSGWEHASRGERKYLRTTLKRLTWQNLGNRFGSQIGHRRSDAIDSVFERLTSFQLTSQIAGTSEATEVGNDASHPEGAVRQVLVNVYERNPVARAKCIEHYGTECAVCGINFGRAYGLIAEGFIHVHHLRPLSSIRSEYVVDPVKDLRPVCPNCHAVLHLLDDPSRVDELSKTVRARRTDRDKKRGG